jgi:serine O-acetyltransferase
MAKRLRTSLLETAAAMRADLAHYLDGPFHDTPLRLTPVRVLRAALTPEVQLVASYRVYHALHTAGLRWPAYALYLASKHHFGCDIAPDAKIGPGLRISHCSDIVVGPDASVGAECVVFNGVTLGNRHLTRDGWGMPTVGDGVMLGTGAKLLGAIEVGDGAVVGANSVVLADVPQGARAVGNPARVLSRRGSS